MSIPFIEENDQTVARHEHLEALRELVGNVYPNKFERSRIVDSEKEDTITAVVEKFRDFQPVEELNQFQVRLAGRIATPPRVMGRPRLFTCPMAFRVFRSTCERLMSLA